MAENRVLKAIGIGLVCVVLGAGTYLLMYQPDSTVAIQVGNQAGRPQPDASIAPVQAAPLDITANVMPTASPTSVSEPSLPPRSDFTLKVQNSGGSSEAVAAILDKAVALGYQAQPADVTGKALARTVIRHKPGFDAVALRAAADLAPGAQLEEHSDISVDLVVAVAKS